MTRTPEVCGRNCVDDGPHSVCCVLRRTDHEGRSRKGKIRGTMWGLPSWWSSGRPTMGTMRVEKRGGRRKYVDAARVALSCRVLFPIVPRAILLKHYLNRGRQQPKRERLLRPPPRRERGSPTLHRLTVSDLHSADCRHGRIDARVIAGAGLHVARARLGVGDRGGRRGRGA